jgi:hypothetical protein
MLFKTKASIPSLQSVSAGMEGKSGLPRYWLKRGIYAFATGLFGGVLVLWSFGGIFRFQGMK